MCSPFRVSRSFLPEGKLEVGSCPNVEEEFAPCLPICALLGLAGAWKQIQMELVVVGWRSYIPAHPSLP